MANVYVRSGAGGAGTGADWANAYTTLAAALTAKAAGDDFWVAGDHAESQASTNTMTSPGTVANPCRVICVDHTGTVPPVSADIRSTATITTTGASGITLAGVAYCEGITFNCGTGASAANIAMNGRWRCKNCAFKLLNTAATSIIRPGNAATARAFWENCTLEFSAVGQALTLNGGMLEWINTASAISGATIPTTFLNANTTGTLILDGVDLSALGSGKTIFGAVTSWLFAALTNCKLDASVTKRTAQTSDNLDANLIHCGSAGNYTFERINYRGDETTETTIVRTGGASDGTQGVAKKIVTTANARFSAPFDCLPIVIWNDVEDTSRTVTVEGIWGGGAVPLNDEIWIEVEYLTNASDPGGGRVSTAKADVLATGGNTTSSSETWGGSTTAFKMAATFTPAQKGPVRIIVKAGKASSTFYICPKVALS